MRVSSVARWSRACFSSKLSAAIAVAALAMGAVGCSPEGPLSDEAAGASRAALNSNPQITNFAVYAQNSATLRDRTVLSGGDVGVRLKGTGPFLVTGYELALVAGVQVDTTHNVIANRVLLQGAKVGDVQTNTVTVQNGGTYAKKYAFPTTMPALPTLAPVFPGTAALTVNPSSTVVASPGAYGAVSIGTKGILRLTGGVYHLASLQLDDEARIEAQAAVQIRVAGRVSGRLSTLARVWIGAASGVTLTAADLRIEVSGKNGGNGTPTDTPMAAVFGNDTTILGVILVPNGTLQIGQRNTVTGALVGRDVYVDMDSKVNFQAGVAVLKCAQFCNDGNPCTKDTCTGEVCSYPSAASGTSCSDGNACNGAETCDSAGKCKAGTPVSCTALDQCHTAGVCDPGTGVCSNPAKSDGTQCDDKNACTVSDICRGGTCSGTTYSCDDGLACTTDACNGTGGCTHTVTANNCAINGACYAAGATNPANACQQCTPATSQTAWSLKGNGTVCRAAAGPCDKAEVCDGTGAGCPPDGFARSSTLCRASAGPCDLPETCTGSSAACPADAFAPVTTVCRASAGPCDLAEMCTGASAACPADVLAPAATVCRAPAGLCDVAETCTGSDAACPPDGFIQASLVCRPVAGSCDVPEVCSGTSPACPADTFLPASTVCRPAARSCDLVEKCDGVHAACPADGKVPDGTACDDQSVCTNNDKCQAGDCVGVPVITCSPSSNPCVVAYCDPGTGACLSAAADGKTCDDGNPATSGEICWGGQCVVPAFDPSASGFCGTPALQAAFLQSGPEAAAAALATERNVQSHIYLGERSPEKYAYIEPVVIPVVFHILEHPSVIHVDDALLVNLVAQANALYSQAWSGTTRARFQQDASATPIRLALAARNPTTTCADSATTGIDRVSVGGDLPNVVKSGEFNEGLGAGTQCSAWPWISPTTHGASAWDPSRYLNVWIVKYKAAAFEQGVSHWPLDPTTGASQVGAACDGVTLNLNNISITSGIPDLVPQTLVHEIGHWLNLYHLEHPNEGGATKIPGTCSGAAQQDCLSGGDFVCDTPAMLGRTTKTCDNTINSCVDNEPDDPPDMNENYMWSATCFDSTMFTVGQVARIQAILASARSALLGSEGDIPPVNAAGGDLWSRDGADDDGSEPDNKQDVVWASDDIWVRNQDDGKTVQQYEDPVFQQTGGTTNDVYVYVRVRNRGCEKASSSTVTLQWAKNSTSLGWPAPWNGTVTLPANGAPMGGTIGSKPTGDLGPGESTVLTFVWKPQDPAQYSSFGGDMTHYCLISTIGTVEQGQEDLVTLVRSRNDMVWRNITVASDSNGRAAYATIRGDLLDNPQGLQFTEPAIAGSPGSLFEWGTVVIDLGPEVFARWAAGGSLGTGIASTSGTKVTLSTEGAQLHNILLLSEEMFTIQASFEPRAAATDPDRSSVDVYRLDITQFDETDGDEREVGGVRVAVKTRRPLPPPIIQ